LFFIIVLFVIGRIMGLGEATLSQGHEMRSAVQDHGVMTTHFKTSLPVQQNFTRGFNVHTLTYIVGSH
jgi:hypothetical protein